MQRTRINPPQHPILFIGPMVRAILEGRKEQTRRVVNPQPEIVYCKYGTPSTGEGLMLGEEKPDDYFGCIIHDTGQRIRCPFGRPGDLLWVRETWRPFHDEADINYRADDSVRRFLVKERWFADDWIKDKKHPRLRWRPSIHMPRWASRITLEVTGVRVERLQEMSEVDGPFAEGFHYPKHNDPFGSFMKSWDALNAKRGFSWESNPWVWVVEFKRLEL